MPEYEFISNDEKREHRCFWMHHDDALDIGAIHHADGREWRRIVSNATVVVKSFQPFVSQSMPSLDPGEDPASSSVICDEWRIDPDSGERLPVFLKEETAKRNALASADAGDRYVVWDD